MLSASLWLCLAAAWRERTFNKSSNSAELYSSSGFPSAMMKVLAVDSEVTQYFERIHDRLVTRLRRACSLRNSVHGYLCL